MYFISEEHRIFFYKCIIELKNDCYHQSLFYLIGSTDTTRHHFSEIYDIATSCINPCCFDKGWQTTGSLLTCRLALNLFNGFLIEEQAINFTPYELFYYGELVQVFFTAIQLRFISTN